MTVLDDHMVPLMLSSNGEMMPSKLSKHIMEFHLMVVP